MEKGYCVCIKDFYNTFRRTNVFFKGKKYPYEYEKSGMSDKQTIWVTYDPNGSYNSTGYRFYLDEEYIFDDYFSTVKQVRKNKLKKLNEL